MCPDKRVTVGGSGFRPSLLDPQENAGHPGSRKFRPLLGFLKNSLSRMYGPYLALLWSFWPKIGTAQVFLAHIWHCSGLFPSFEKWLFTKGRSTCAMAAMAMGRRLLQVHADWAGNAQSVEMCRRQPGRWARVVRPAQSSPGAGIRRRRLGRVPRPSSRRRAGREGCAATPPQRGAPPLV